VQAAVLPVGSFEQHGAHLPLTTDTLITQTIADAVADTYDLFLLPPVTFSCSHERASSPGTVSISSATLTSVIRDVATSLRRSGIPVLVLVNGHGGKHVLSNIVHHFHRTPPVAAAPVRAIQSRETDQLEPPTRLPGFQMNTYLRSPVKS
jgi:creatinine amidohydrolase